jgi:hypothetical protein
VAIISNMLGKWIGQMSSIKALWKFFSLGLNNNSKHNKSSKEVRAFPLNPFDFVKKVTSLFLNRWIQIKTSVFINLWEMAWFRCKYF